MRGRSKNNGFEIGFGAGVRILNIEMAERQAHKQANWSAYVHSDALCIWFVYDEKRLISFARQNGNETSSEKMPDSKMFAMRHNSRITLMFNLGRPSE